MIVDGETTMMCAFCYDTVATNIYLHDCPAKRRTADRKMSEMDRYVEEYEGPIRANERAKCIAELDALLASKKTPWRFHTGYEDGVEHGIEFGIQCLRGEK